MDEIVRKAYNVFWQIFFVIFLLMLLFFKLDMQEQDVKDGFEVLTDYEKVVYEDITAPLKTRTAYSFVLDGVEGPYCHLMTHSAHQEVRVFLDDECIYNMIAGEIDFSGRSPGGVWNHIVFSEADNGKTVKIEFAPVYRTAIDEGRPTFFLGNESDITRNVILHSMPNFILSLFAILVGVALVIIVYCNYKKSDVEGNLMMLGYAILQIGLLKLSMSDMIALLFPNRPAFTIILPMSLMLMWIPVTMVCKNLYSTREKTIWYVPCYIGFAIMTLAIVLQYMGALDMYQMLPVVRFNIFLIFGIIVIMTVREVREKGWNIRIIQNLCCMGMCLVGELTETLLTYLFRGQTLTGLSMLCYLVYAAVMGYHFLDEAKDYMEVGIKAKRYESMAFHDQLTGLYNRTAFAEHTNSVEFFAEKCIIIVMDLNNLKGCNDKLGHSKGDIYIKETARMIQECFDDIGNCYRMGGDEFYVLLQDANPSLCKQRLQELKARVASCDKVGSGFRMGIACGYKMYDGHMDYDIHETARRADKMMYQDKFAMKEL